MQLNNRTEEWSRGINANALLAYFYPCSCHSLNSLDRYGIPGILINPNSKPFSSHSHVSLNFKPFSCKLGSVLSPSHSLVSQFLESLNFVSPGPY